ncbi:MAG: hypothetical protein N2Z70_06595 [Bdellovibrionaceae bacterium]|jgi:hypothetical protein|nr:hypothetical protein [Pseudobdellovibrionaceae bacterium]
MPEGIPSKIQKQPSSDLLRGGQKFLQVVTRFGFWCLLLFVTATASLEMVWAQSPESQIVAQDNLFSNSPWGVSYFNFSSTSVGLAEEGMSSWNIYQYIALNRRFDWSNRLSIRVPFTTQTPGVYDSRKNVRSWNTQLNDFHVVFNQFQFLELPHEWDVSGSYYMYLPTSESSKERKWLTRLRAWWTLEHRPSRRSMVALWVEPEYFLNTQKAYRSVQVNTAPDGRTFERVFARNNMQGSLQVSLVYSYAIHNRFTPQISLYHDQQWFEDSQFVTGADTYRSALGAQFASWIQINRTLRFLAGYSTEVAQTGRFAQDAKWFDPRNSQYFIMTFWNLF